LTVANLTQTAEQTLDVIEAFKAARMPLNEAKDFTSALLEKALDDIEANPLLYPVDLSAQEYGITLRRWIDPENQYVCLYRYFPEPDVAILDIFASTRQDYQSLLYMILISRRD